MDFYRAVFNDRDAPRIPIARIIGFFTSQESKATKVLALKRECWRDSSDDQHALVEMEPGVKLNVNG
jgi:hypothetical protein